MRKLTILSPILLLIAWSCQDNTPSKISAESIHQIQLSIDSVDQDSVYTLLKQTEQQLAREKQLPDSLRGMNHYLLGLHFRKKEIKDSASIYFQQATNYVKDSIVNQTEANYFRLAWDSYYHRGLYTDCFVISERFKSMLDPAKQYTAMNWALYWEESTYKALKQYKKALAVAEERVALTRKYDSMALPSSLVSLAEFHYNYLKDKKTAFSILEDLLKDEEHLSKNFQRMVNTNYGVYRYYEGDFKGALKYYLKAVNAARKDTLTTDNLDDLANTYNNVAEVYIDLKDYPKARMYLDSVRGLGLQNMARSKQRSLLNYELRLAMESGKNLDKVKEVLQEINDLTDKEYRDKFDTELMALTQANEKEKQLLEAKQAAEIETLKLETRSLIGLVTALLLGVIGFLFYQRRRLRFEKQELQNQQRLLRSQMNPHFTYNTLYAIQNEIKQDPDSAGKYLIKFSRLLRLILENSTKNYVALEKELEALRKYMDLQQVRLKHPFTYRITLVGLEEDELIFIPPMLIQPFVENAIEHGFQAMKEPGFIEIKLEYIGDFLACSIEDNGCGIVAGTSDKKDSTSMRLISEFIKKTTKETLVLIDKKEQNPQDSGILIQFLIPFKYTEND